MKHIFSLFLFCGVTHLAFCQTTAPSSIVINFGSHQIYSVTGGTTTSVFKDIIIILPQKDFENIKIAINKKFVLAFKCPGKTDSCKLLYSTDIASGKVVLHFKNKTLFSIGSRVSPYTDDILTGKDAIEITGLKDVGKNLVKDTVKTPIPFINSEPAKGSDVKNESSSYLTKVCADTDNLDSSLGGIPDFTFLCINYKTKSNCTCGIPITNAFENMYLAPCFDKDGNAISVENQVLYDMSASDPLRKIFLFDIENNKIKKDQECVGLQGRSFEYAKIQKSISPRVGDILAVSVIAHKDSSIIIDSNFINYHLDSAAAVEKAFTSAGINKSSSGTPESKDTLKLTTHDTKSETFLKGAFTLNGDLAYFNNVYSDLNFLQEKYTTELHCLQQKIVEFFLLKEAPSNGKQLAQSIEKLLIDNSLAKIYYKEACRLLEQIEKQYDIALNRKGNYRVFTQVMQVPNADELTIGMRTKNNTSPLYRHKFIIKGGIKIDFSTGVFLTGLNSRNYVLTSLRFHIKDSVSGTQRDTIGNLIQANEKKMNFSTGFLVHIYKRSGNNMNFGLATGVTINNSDFMWLLGGSVMFRMGSGRISFVGGAAMGKQQALDANHKQYLYDRNAVPQSNTYLRQDLIRFFPDTNISTYEKKMISWFAGITYNFAGLKL